MGLLSKIEQYAGTAILYALMSYASGCDKKEEREEYKGSADDAVAEVSTPKEAQNFINKYIAYKDRSNKIRGVNGGTTYSLNKLLDKNEGLCRDGAVGSAVMLKDDGFPSLYLDRCPIGKRGHAVFVYQDPSNRDMNPNTPNWGSVGINNFDFREPKSTLDQIVSEIDSKFKYANDGFYSLHDLSLFDLKYGADGWVNDVLCMIFRRNLGVVSPDGVGSVSSLSPGIIQSDSSWSDNVATINESCTYDSN